MLFTFRQTDRLDLDEPALAGLAGLVMFGYGLTIARVQTGLTVLVHNLLELWRVKP